MEEMWRTVTYFEWLACEWERQVTAPLKVGSEVDGMTKAGVSAYSYKQAAIYRKMVDVFTGDWCKSLKSKSLGSAWLQRYSTPAPTKRSRCLPSNVQLHHPTSVRGDIRIIEDDRSNQTDDDTDALDPDSEYNPNHMSDNLLKELTDT